MLQILKGIALGAGAILPGISSGVLCVVFGIYEKLIDSILGFFKDVKNNLKFLFPLLIGVFIGVVLFGNILNYVFTNFHNLSCFCFIGLILGSIPSIIEEARGFRQARGLPLQNVVALLFTLSLSLFLIALELSGNVSAIQNNTASFFELVLAGFAMSAGIVIPGMSSTVILMLAGKYSLYLSAVASLNLSLLVPMGIGLVFGSIVLLVLIKFMLAYFRDVSYFAIIGFVLGSIPVLFPSNVSGSELMLGAVLALFCCFIVVYIKKFAGK